MSRGEGARDRRRLLVGANRDGGRRRRRCRTCTNSRLTVATPNPGEVELDPRRDRARRARTRRGHAARRRRRATSWASRINARRPSSLIPVTGRTGGPRPQLAGSAHGDRLPRLARARPSSRTQSVGDEAEMARRALRPARRASSVSPRSRRGSPGTSAEGATYVSDHSNASVSGLVDVAPRRLGSADPGRP